MVWTFPASLSAESIDWKASRKCRSGWYHNVSSAMPICSCSVRNPPPPSLTPSGPSAPGQQRSYLRRNPPRHSDPSYIHHIWRSGRRSGGARGGGLRAAQGWANDVITNAQPFADQLVLPVFASGHRGSEPLRMARVKDHVGQLILVAITLRNGQLYRRTFQSAVQRFNYGLRILREIEPLRPSPPRTPGWVWPFPKYARGRGWDCRRRP